MKCKANDSLSITSLKENKLCLKIPSTYLLAKYSEDKAKISLHTDLASLQSHGKND